MQVKRASAWVFITIISMLALGISTNAMGVPQDERRLSAADERLAKQQEPLLDPQSDPGTKPALTDPHSQHNHGAEDDSSGPSDETMRLAPSAALAASVGGQWKYASGIPTNFYAIHTIVGPGGKILLVAGSGNSVTAFKAKSFKSYLCTPA
ncbi:MAG: hypothetical protein AVDCRST_MAG93-6395, partial [uncultured Chloroflexia bacterium]